MASTVRLRVVAVILTLAAAACSGNDQAPSSRAAADLQSIQVGFAGTGSSSLSVGQTAQLLALGSYSDNTQGDITSFALWRTSDPKVATVSAAGVVTGVAAGSVNILALLGSQQGTLHLDLTSTCGYALAPAHLVFGALGSSATVTVTPTSSDCRWTAKSDVDWVNLTFDPGVSGTRSFSYSVPANNFPTPRSGHIVVTGTDGSTATTGFDEEAPLCSYVAVPDHAVIPLSGGSAQFQVNVTPASCAWTISAGSGITVTSPGVSNVGSALVNYTLAPNTTFPGSIRIVASPTSSPSFTYTITH